MGEIEAREEQVTGKRKTSYGRLRSRRVKIIMANPNSLMRMCINSQALCLGQGLVNKIRVSMFLFEVCLNMLFRIEICLNVLLF